ncbi:unnamed protein product [[Candida] boidinii]|nr:unnamed protein product [[Candida] boidinii]
MSSFSLISSDVLTISSPSTFSSGFYFSNSSSSYYSGFISKSSLDFGSSMSSSGTKTSILTFKSTASDSSKYGSYTMSYSNTATATIDRISNRFASNTKSSLLLTSESIPYIDEVSTTYATTRKTLYTTITPKSDSENSPDGSDIISANQVASTSNLPFFSTVTTGIGSALISIKKPEGDVISSKHITEQIGKTVSNSFSNSFSTSSTSSFENGGETEIFTGSSSKLAFDVLTFITTIIFLLFVI